MITEKEIKHLLYEDEDGDVIGLDEVQLLEPIPTKRVSLLRELLNGKDLYVAYQAALILAAWNDEEGLKTIDGFIDNKIHMTMEVSPHRLYGYDNVYDEIAWALYLSIDDDENPSEYVLNLIKKILRLYGPCDFEGSLKLCLLDINCSDLLSDIYKALERALDLNKEYLASQLLPILAKWNHVKRWELITSFLAFKRQTPDPAHNIAEALGYINTIESKNILSDLSKHPEMTVVEEARKSLDGLEPFQEGA
ncbi:MAG: hypothetical protein HKP58_20415 [Desulfatitalea sp.]|nr:hypothetical protein [Desulfatitalea sp.]NNK02783.1 hypothetical protein [Desulfatitalea sp.]